MKIVKPSVELWLQSHNEYEHIAKCARVCYASNKTIASNDKAFCKRLWANKHKSMYRHAAVYYIIPEALNLNWKAYTYCNIVMIEGVNYISTNKQCAKEYFQKYKRFRITNDEAWNNPIFKDNGLLMLTFCIHTGIDITREYNRKSPNAISEQSTRYVDFNKRIGIRFKHCHWMTDLNWYKRTLVKLMCKIDEWFYKISRSKFGLNLPPEDARYCLFLDTMSTAVYTYSIKEWEYILNMRLFDWTGVAHKDAKEIASQIYDYIVNYVGINIKNYKVYELNNSKHMV